MWCKLRGAWAVAGEESGGWFAVREIEAAHACAEEFAAHRGHRVVEVDLDREARSGDGFGGNKPGGARADDGDTFHCGVAGVSLDSLANRARQPPKPSLRIVSKLRSTITSAMSLGDASTAWLTLASRSRCSVGYGARLV